MLAAPGHCGAWLASLLYLRYVDLWDAVETLREVLATRAFDRPEYRRRATVT